MMRGCVCRWCGEDVTRADERYEAMDGRAVHAECMEEFLLHLKAKNYQKRTVGIMENGSWAPQAAKKMRAILEQMKAVEICEPVISIRSAAKEADRICMEQLAKVLLEK